MRREDYVTGVEFVEESELVNNDEMERLGFKRILLTKKTTFGTNVTQYFLRDDLEYVYVECYFAIVNTCARFIISKSYFDILNMSEKMIFLKTGSGDGSRGVPCVSCDGKNVAIHKAVYRDREVDHVSNSLNIITEEDLRACSTWQNAKNKKGLHSWGMLENGKFFVRIEETQTLLNDKDIELLRAYGYKVALQNRTRLYKEYDTEIEAIKALRAYEDIFYKEFTYNPLQDMRGHFQAKFEQLILGTKTKDDVTREILEDYRNDAKAIARYNLESEYERLGINSKP